MIRKSLVFVTLALLVLASAAQAGSSPQEQRHHLMEDVRDAAKPVSKMLKGEMDFDAATAMSSFQTWSEAAAVFGDLFPEGSETGHGTEAKSTIWSDREGFNAARNDRADQVSMHPGVVSRDDGFATSDLTNQHRFDNPVVRVRITRTD